MTVNEIIDGLEGQALDKYHLANRDPDSMFLHDADVLMEASRMLKELEEERAPLTLEELREMAGDPVYTTRKGWLICYGLVSEGDEIHMDVGTGIFVPMDGYGKDWFAYHQKPEEGTA